MSELKARTARSIADAEEMLELVADCPIEQAQVYLKSEADKVIEELKKKINEAQTELELWRDGSIISEAHQKELDGKRHSDYKRCLAMAEWCKSEQTYSSFSIYVTEHPKSRWASRSVPVGAWFVFWKNRELRWLKLADKFKEAK